VMNLRHRLRLIEKKSRVNLKKKRNDGASDLAL
jgi:hypothetical protein